MLRPIVALALLVVACKSSDPGGSASSTPSSGGHAGIQDATKAFADALATGDPAKVRAEMPPRAALAKYFACDQITARIDTTAEHAITRPTAAPKGGTFLGVGDTQTHVIDGDLDGCRVTEQILVVEVTTRWKVGDQEQTSALQLVRLGKRWYTFDLPAE
ncbi:MAG TPA: hypothetical protein VM513_34815 [Kofleriaceae bacterium]|jgi:hypothetical protein|nr:hypothetical protein [Kofleriaceae bacterium]